MLKLTNKYAPTSFETYVGQETIVQAMKELIKKGYYNMPNLLFGGDPGVGKTEMAKIVYDELLEEIDHIVWKDLNASDDRGINVVREIKRLARKSNPYLFFLDEADQMTPDAQHALRVIMEDEQYRSARFILSCNHPNKIIPALHSRCAVYRFKRHSIQSVVQRLVDILVEEEIDFEWSEDPDNPTEHQQAIYQIAKNRKGDLRGSINDLSLVLTQDKEINLRAVAEHTPSNVGADIFSLAFDGTDFKLIRARLEEVLLDSNIGWEDLLMSFFDLVPTVKPEELGLRIYTAVADTEATIRAGNRPIVQFTKLMSKLVMLPYLYRIKQPTMQERGYHVPTDGRDAEFDKEYQAEIEELKKKSFQEGYDIGFQEGTEARNKPAMTDEEIDELIIRMVQSEEKGVDREFVIGTLVKENGLARGKVQERIDNILRRGTFFNPTENKLKSG